MFQESINDETKEDKCQENSILNHNYNDINDDINKKMPTQLEESEIIKSSKTSEICKTGEKKTTDSEISSKKIIQVVNMEVSESVGGGHCWTPIEKEKTIQDKMASMSPIEEPISLIIPGIIPKNSQVLISDGPHNTSLETNDHEAVISSKVTLSLIPVSIQ